MALAQMVLLERIADRISTHQAFDSVSPTAECLTTFNRLRSPRGANKLKYIIYKISDDQQSVEVEDSSSSSDYDAFREKLSSSVDKDGYPSPRFAVYDVEYDLGRDGKRSRIVFIHWIGTGAHIKLCMLYASTKEYFRRTLSADAYINADDAEDIEWTNILAAASGGKA